MAKKKYTYYSIDKLMSLNAVYNFCVGGRGIGKTYGFKKYAISQAIKGKGQFIYLRRYKPELKGRSEFFADVAWEFPDYDFRAMGKLAQCAPVETRDDKKREWTTIGFFVALSVAQNEKSVPYPNVKTILFDEFILSKESGAIRYLPHEDKAFNDFYSTVDRYQDKTRVFFIANSVSIDNPYFVAYKIRPDEMAKQGVDLQRSHGGFVAVHLPESAEYQAEVYRSRFGEFIKGSEYASFAVENTFADGHVGMVDVKPDDAKYQYTLALNVGVVSVWYYGDGHFHVQQRRPGNEIFFTLNASDMDDDKILVMRSDRIIGSLRTAFRHARMTFDSPETRNLFLDIFKN